jgi:hypothetical protein
MMKKLFILFIFIGFALVGCSQKPNNEVSEATTETVKEDWNISPAFTISKPGSDGKDVDYVVRGIDGKLAIVDGPVMAMANNKELFHFWGGTPEKTEQLFGKKVKVIGTSKENGETVTAFEGSIGFPNEEIIKPPHHYAESVGYLNLPSKGIWKLDAYIEDELFGSIVIEVQEE